MKTLHGTRDLLATLLTGVLITTASQATVSAAHTPQASFADLGVLTVTAPRIADARVADLGAMTVTARRITTVTVASARPARGWK